MLLRALLLLFVLTVPALAQPLQNATAAPAKSPTADPAAALRAKTFETVWRIVNEKFYDPTFNGVDWKAVHDRYAPRVEAVENDTAFYRLMNEMLGELKASHFNVLPPQAAQSQMVDNEDDSWGGGAGMLVRVVEGRPIITQVDADGPAAKAELRPGFVVTSIGGHDLAEAVRQIDAREETEVRRRFFLRRVVESWFYGMPGTSIEVAYLDAENRPHTATLVREDRPGRPLTFGNLPTYLAQIESRQLDDGIGYLRFNIFLPQLMDEIRTAIAGLRDSKAIILDLRGNPGGYGFMVVGVAALFLEDAEPLGVMKLRNGEIRFKTVKQKSPYTGRLVILVDEGSASTSEILAGALQESGRATVVGEPSLGAVLPSVIEKLPNGAIFQYAVADFKTPKGVLLEGTGVHPNLALVPTRKDYLSGRDPVLDAAVDLLTTSSEATSSR